MSIIDTLLGRKKKSVKVIRLKEARIKDLVNTELKGYIKREDLQSYIDTIQRNKEKKKIWDGLSTRQKLKLVKHMAEKRGLENAKK